VLSQAVAPQVASLVEQAAWQQFPLPLMPQIPEAHVAFPVHGAPSARPPPVVVPVVLVLPVPVVPVPVVVVADVPVDDPLPLDEVVVPATPPVLVPLVPAVPLVPELDVGVIPPPQAATRRHPRLTAPTRRPRMRDSLDRLFRSC
jgi:hypothetical protein